MSAQSRAKQLRKIRSKLLPTRQIYCTHGMLCKSCGQGSAEDIQLQCHVKFAFWRPQTNLVIVKPPFSFPRLSDQQSGSLWVRCRWPHVCRILPMVVWLQLMAIFHSGTRVVLLITIQSYIFIQNKVWCIDRRCHIKARPSQNGRIQFAAADMSNFKHPCAQLRLGTQNLTAWELMHATTSRKRHRINAQSAIIWPRFNVRHGCTITEACIVQSEHDGHIAQSFPHIHFRALGFAIILLPARSCRGGRKCISCTITVSAFSLTSCCSPWTLRVHPLISYALAVDAPPVPVYAAVRQLSSKTAFTEEYPQKSSFPTTIYL